MEQENIEVENTFDPLWENYLQKLDDLDIVEKTKWMKLVEPLIELPFITKNYFPLNQTEFLEKMEKDLEFKEKWGQ